MSETVQHVIEESNAGKIAGWFKDRGGIAVWRSINLSNLGVSWTTPLRQENGEPAAKPTWEAETTPSLTITDPANCIVTKRREVKRIKIAIERGSGLQLNLTTGSSNRLRQALSKASEAHGGAASSYEFDDDQAIIYVDDNGVPLPEWIAQHQVPA